MKKKYYSSDDSAYTILFYYGMDSLDIILVFNIGGKSFDHPKWIDNLNSLGGHLHEAQCKIL